MKDKAKTGSSIELAITLVVFLLVNLVSAKYQPLISRENGRPWESANYYKIAEEFRAGLTPEGPSPWIARIGTPFVAAVFPVKDLMKSFLYTNVIANGLAALLLVIWLRFFITSWKVRILLVLVFLLSFHSMTRRVYYVPVMIDHWDKVWLLAGLIGIHKARSWRMPWPIVFLAIVTFISVFFRGVLMLIPVMLLFVDNPIGFDREKFTFSIKSWPKKNLYIPLFFGLLAILLCNALVIVNNEGTYAGIRLLGRIVYDMLVPTYLLGWFIAYGPLLALVVYNWRSTLSFLMKHQYQFVCLLSVMALSWVGGNTVYRYSFWAFPIIFVLIGRAMEEHMQEVKVPLFAGILAASVVISQRMFMLWPDHPSSFPSRYPVFTPLGNDVPMIDVIGIGNAEICAIALLEYLAFSVCIVLYLYYQERRMTKARVAN